MSKARVIICFFLLTLLSPYSWAQTPTTQGKEFWVSFMKNGYRNEYATYNKLSLVISAKRGCTGTIYNPHNNWSMNFEVEDHEVEMVFVPDSQAYNDQSDGVAFMGLYVVSSDTISLYIGNEAQNSYDAANVLPAPALGSEYIIQTYESSGHASNHDENNRASFLVVATEDATEVDIVPTAVTAESHQPGVPYSVTLDRGQCYHVMTLSSSNGGDGAGDFSGTTVVARDNKKIAVFNGNSITSVPGGQSTGYDHIFEQAMPTDYWGKRFVVTSTKCPSNMNLQEDYVKLTAFADDTHVQKDGEDLCVLQAGESQMFSLNLDVHPYAYLESDNPMAVYLIQHSHGTSQPQYGDPSMVWISPVEQTICEVTFSTFQVQEIEKHFVNIVCHREDATEVRLDGQIISLGFQSIPENPAYSFARVEVQHGVHTLQCSRGFVAHVYGIGESEGYAYSVGSSAKLLTKQLYINDELSSTLPNGYHCCQSADLQFRTEVNYEYAHIDWTFGDGNTAQGPEVTHSYSDASDYTVQSIVYREIENVVQPFDTLTATIHVHPVYEGTVAEFSTCGDTYPYNGQDYPVPYDDFVHLESLYGCDSIVHLIIDSDEISFHTEQVQACEEYTWFGETYTESNRYEHWVYDYNEEGCDSLYVLWLYVGHPSVNTLPAVDTCKAYYWQGRLLEESGTYYETITTAAGCDSVLVLPFTRIGLEEVHETMTACETTTWHGIPLTQSGSYEYTTNHVQYCDTLYTLDFTMGDAVSETITWEGCDEYEWYDTLRTESGVYYHTVEGQNGCDSLFTLHLTLYPSPAFSEIDGLSIITVASSYWSGTYNYYVDGMGMEPDSIHWEIVDNPGWGLYPNGASCKVTATSMGTVVLRVWTTGLCGKEVTKTIFCGGFGVEDNNIKMLNIYPNPTHSILTIEGDLIEYVSVYDGMGQRLIHMEAHGDETVSVDMSGLASGIYAVEVTFADGAKDNRLIMYQP